jgi:hypothetical protein
MIFLMCFWVLFVIILLRIFSLMFIKDIGINVLNGLGEVCLSGFGMSVILAS